MNKLFHLLLTLLLAGSGFQALAQKKPKSFDPQLYVLQDSLKNLSYKIINNRDEVERRNGTFVFIRTLVAALKLPNSFEFPFDSVKSISILTSDDKRFRIFTWHLLTDDGKYRYFGAIQKNNKEKLELYSLFDNSPFIPNPEDTVLNVQSWYGAHYYKIVSPKKGNRKNKKYVLLGWKGNDLKTTKKVIDVVYFGDDGKPVFGAPIFKYKDETKYRVVFEYTRQASMMLRYLDKKKWIIYDHIAAPNNSSIGNYEVYGPDLSYDGLRYRFGKWVLMEKIDLRNEKSEMDKLFNDPTQ